MRQQAADCSYQCHQPCDILLHFIWMTILTAESRHESIENVSVINFRPLNSLTFSLQHKWHYLPRIERIPRVLLQGQHAWKQLPCTSIGGGASSKLPKFKSELLLLISRTSFNYLSTSNCFLSYGSYLEVQQYWFLVFSFGYACRCFGFFE